MKWITSLGLVAIARTMLRAVDARDMFFFGGLAAICYGVAQVYPPAAWVVGGAVFLALGRG